MSANTSITEGGKARPFGPVKALMVQGEDGKYYPWFPESDRALGTLSVDKNGIYRASDKGVYGWSSVSVNVPQNEGVTGKDPDTGEDVYVHPDPETGELVTDVLPVEIRVIEPPTNPYGTYVDGQTITKDGMVVKAYTATGDEYGTVPNGEITLNPTTATYDESTDTGTGNATLDGETVNYAHGANWAYETEENGRMVSYVLSAASSDYLVNLRGILYAFSKENKNKSSYSVTRTVQGGEPVTNKLMFAEAGSLSYSYNGEIKIAYLYYCIYPYRSDAIARTDMEESKIAKILFEGEHEGGQVGSRQTINVSWPRPGDGAVLETTFDILVGPHGGTGDD